MNLSNLLSVKSYRNISNILITCFAFFSCLSIAASQLATLLLLIHFFTIKFFVFLRKNNYLTFKRIKIDSKFLEYKASSNEGIIYQITLLLVASQVISSFSGIDLQKSLEEVLRRLPYMFFPFAICLSITCCENSDVERIRKIKTYIAFAVFGQCFASVYAILKQGFKENILLPHLPWSMTAAGLLVLIMPLLVSLFILTVQFNRKAKIMVVSRNIFGIKLSMLLYSTIFLASILMLSWPEIFSFSSKTNIQYFGMFSAITLILVLIKDKALEYIEDSNTLTQKLKGIFIVMILPVMVLLISSLLLNLKRGPWIGALSALFILGIFITKKINTVFLTLSILIILFLTPVRNRLLTSSSDFLVAGGRSDMWSIGLDFVSRLPLGLGSGNALFMQEVNPLVPEQHRHMHNNFLNIAVENGVLGLAIFICYIFLILRTCYKANRYFFTRQDNISSQSYILSAGMLSSLLGWQIAGLVEYNYGTSSIRLLALFITGLILVIDKMAEKPT